ncbi:MAG: ATP-dependent RecD-like DNA helicase [Bacteroidales bacterium]|nr:ATP-dependent RecD-like DNA helicase [Bacteroidales bacterium]
MMNKKNVSRGKVKVKRVIYSKNGWGVLLFELLELIEGSFETEKDGTFTATGSIADPAVGEEYELKAELVNNPKYGQQYNIISLISKLYVDEGDPASKKGCLEALFTTNIVKEMYDALEDPFMALKNRDFEGLVKVRGCGIVNAIKWSDRFEKKYVLNLMLQKMSNYSLTETILKKLLEYYKSPDIIEQKLRDNPYELTVVHGVGFHTADAIAMANGFDIYDPRRIFAFISFNLAQVGEEGRSFLSNVELMDRIIDYFGEDIPNLAIADAMHTDEAKQKIWASEDKEFIGLKYYYDLEKSVADQMFRIMQKDTSTHNDFIDDDIRYIEEQQGWDFTEQQKNGIKTALSSSLTVINGSAGTGKTSIISAIVRLAKRSVALCALSGKAAVRLGEASGMTGQTIHRLLGYNPSVGFTRNEENPLDYELVVIDESSMISASLFNRLLKAIPEGTKVIMLGDTGQLEAIGNGNVLHDVIKSGVVPVVTLDKIHRQAQDSAIITESINIRNGIQIISKNEVGVQVRGKNKDLIIDCYSDKSNTYYKILEHYGEELKRHNGDISMVQIIVPIKSKGDACTWAINKAIQNEYNPDIGQESIDVYYPSHGKEVLREGDKVINVRNTYDALNTLGEVTPLFNGNIGVIKTIDPVEGMVIVDFQNIGEIVLSGTMLQNLELAYAITVHKFQGAQTDTVIFGIDYSSYVFLTREMLYTGITRAQKKCILVVQNSAVRAATATQAVSKKMTHLSRLLVEKKEGSRKLVF